jgi:spermidine synthase
MDVKSDFRSTKWFLLLVTALSGACLMSLEIAASRVLAPAFGGGLYVWGSVIGVIMAAMAAGYYAGGIWSREVPGTGRLFKAYLFAAIYVSLLPALGYMVVIEATILGLVLGPLVASLLLFAAPTAALALTSPYIVSCLARRGSDAGESAGQVFAVGTVGSIFGTFATAFIMLPMVGTRATILADAAVIFALCAVGLWNNNRLNCLFVVFMIPGFLASPYAPDNLIYRTESAYNVISVYDFPDYRMMTLNWDLFFQQTMIRKEGFLTGSYYDAFSLGPILGGGGRVLWLGLAAGGSARELVEVQGADVDGVDIDPKVVEVGKAFFGMAEGERLRIHIMDGRQFLRGAGKYDVINVDVFNGADIPTHMATVEFFREASDHLNDNGMVMINVLTLRGERSLRDGVASTMKAVFPSVYTLDLGGNCIVVAFKRKIWQGELSYAVGQVSDPKLKALASGYVAKMSEFNSGDGLVFTDDLSRMDEFAFRGQRRIYHES